MNISKRLVDLDLTRVIWCDAVQGLTIPYIWGTFCGSYQG